MASCEESSNQTLVWLIVASLFQSVSSKKITGVLQNEINHVVAVISKLPFLILLEYKLHLPLHLPSHYPTPYMSLTLNLHPRHQLNEQSSHTETN